MLCPLYSLHLSHESPITHTNMPIEFRAFLARIPHYSKALSIIFSSFIARIVHDWNTRSTVFSAFVIRITHYSHVLSFLFSAFVARMAHYSHALYFVFSAFVARITQLRNFSILCIFSQNHPIFIRYIISIFSIRCYKHPLLTCSVRFILSIHRRNH